MQAIQRRIQREREFNLLIARWAAMTLRHRGGALTPATLEELQRWNRELRLDVDRWLSLLRERRGTRGQRIARRFGSTTAVHAARLAHDRALKNLQAMLRRRETVLRQVGDACAWMVLGGRTRVLFPLYNGGKLNPLPTNEGLWGPSHVATEAHATGRFLVIQNDLTRCLCTGDLTVVRADGPWRHPAVFEVKTSKPDPDGKSRITMLGTEGGWPTDIALVRDFREVLGFQLDDDAALDARAERQMQEILSRADLMHDISGSGMRPLSADGRTTWRALENVLRHALVHGTGFDLLEAGVYVAAVRCEPTDDFAALAGEVLGRVAEELNAAPGTDGWSVGTSGDLLDNPAAAPVVPPILLWRIGPELAARLVAQELFMAGYVRRSVWEDAFRAAGVSFSVEDDGGWVLRQGTGRVTFNQVEVAKLTGGVIYSGISPTAVAAAVAEDLRRQH